MMNTAIKSDDVVDDGVDDDAGAMLVNLYVTIQKKKIMNECHGDLFEEETSACL
jgi:hypothetical protein